MKIYIWDLEAISSRKWGASTKMSPKNHHYKARICVGDRRKCFNQVYKGLGLEQLERTLLREIFILILKDLFRYRFSFFLRARANISPNLAQHAVEGLTISKGRLVQMAHSTPRPFFFAESISICIGHRCCQLGDLVDEGYRSDLSIRTWSLRRGGKVSTLWLRQFPCMVCPSGQQNIIMRQYVNRNSSVGGDWIVTRKLPYVVVPTKELIPIISGRRGLF